MKGLIKKLVAIHMNPTKNSYGIDLDLSYITDQIIVCSCPTTSTKSSLYRNSLEDLVNYLSIQHRYDWHIWNLRSEMDQNAYNLDDPLLANHITYMPCRDHECPTFEYLCSILSDIGEYLSHTKSKRVAVIHCKLGKGRSGLICVGLLISSFGYTQREARALFTQKRMRSGFGEGVSIVSQVRYSLYVELTQKQVYNPEKRSAIIKCIRLRPCAIDSHASNIMVRLIPITADCSNSKVDQTLVGDLMGDETSSSQCPSLIFRLLHADSSPVPLDLKIVVERVASGAVPIKLSHAFTCFNLFWEDYQQIPKNSLSLSEPGTVHLTRFQWDSFDGFKGLSKKGLKIFDELELEWEYLFDTEAETL